MIAPEQSGTAHAGTTVLPERWHRLRFPLLLAFGLCLLLVAQQGRVPVAQGSDTNLYVPFADVRTPAVLDRSTTAGNIWLSNHGPAPITIERIEPLHVSEGIARMRLAGYYVWQYGAPIGTAAQFDPYPAGQLVPVAGAIIAPEGDSDHRELQVPVSIQLAVGVDTATIDGFLIRYRIGGTHYEMRVDNRIEVFLPEG